MRSREEKGSKSFRAIPASEMELLESRWMSKAQAEHGSSHDLVYDIFIKSTLTRDHCRPACAAYGGAKNPEASIISKDRNGINVYPDVIIIALSRPLSSLP